MNANQPSSPAKLRINQIARALLRFAVCSTLLCLWDLDDLDRVRAQAADASTLASTVKSSATPAETDYLLGPLDKVKLKVFAWRPSRDEVYEWKALNDVYSVSASGQVSLPLIGDVPAGGSSLRELGQAVSDRLKEKLGLIEAPSAIAEIVEFRPFYILGAVQHPGEYSYRPHLTIIQALSIAGGLPRLNELDDIRLDRDAITATGDRHLIESEISSLVARRARLEAESTGASSVEFPPGLTQPNGGVWLESLLLEEQKIFNARRSAFESRSRELERMRELLQKDLQSSEESLEAQNSYVRVAKQEFKQFDELFQKKLTTINRIAESARNVMQVQGELLRIESSLTRGRQDISRIEMELFDLRYNRVSEAAAEFRTTQARLDELKRKYATAERLLESSVSFRRLVSTADPARKGRVNYTIIRSIAGASVEVAATEATVVQPGDTIKVELPFRNDLPPAGIFDSTVPAQRTALSVRAP
jgi:polysaccharide export outer membrane protein/exopolysaccharide production protein ExoF